MPAAVVTIDCEGVGRVAELGAVLGVAAMPRHNSHQQCTPHALIELHVRNRA